MSVKLIAYSIIQVAPPGYTTPYGVGIIENENHNRELVRIKTDYLSKLSLRLEGEIKKEPIDSAELNFFYPK